MQKRLALLFIALIIILALVPFYYQPADEALGQGLCDAHVQIFASTGIFSFIDDSQRGVSMSLSSAISYHLPKALSSSTVTRGPPA